MPGQEIDQFEQPAREGEIIQPTDQLPALSAEVNQAIVTARAYPRKRDAELVRIMKERCTLSQESAEESVYSLPRGNKELVGPSIRFAENIMGVYGNCRVGAEYIGVDRKEKMVVVRATFWDLESNMLIQRLEARRCSYANGGMYSPDMIAQTIKAAMSIATRNAVLAGIPKAIWSEAYYAANGLIIGDVKDFPKRLEKSIAAFADLGVGDTDLISMLDITGREAMRPNHLPVLRGIFNSLRDGSETVESIVARRKKEGGGHAEVANPLADKPAGKTIPRGSFSLFAAADYIITETGKVTKNVGTGDHKMILNYNTKRAYCVAQAEPAFAAAALEKGFSVLPLSDFKPSEELTDAVATVKTVDAPAVGAEVVATAHGAQQAESGPGAARDAPPAAPAKEQPVDEKFKLPPAPTNEREYAIWARKYIANSRYNQASTEEIIGWYNGPQQKSMRNKCFVSPELKAEIQAEIEGGA